MKPIIYLLLILLTSISCKTETEIVKTKLSTLEPIKKHGEPLFENNKTLLVPIRQNYIMRNNKRLLLYSEDWPYNSFISGSSYYKEKETAIVNYEFRKIDTIKMNFKKMFHKNLLVLDEINYKDGYENNSNHFPLKIFVVIENDTNNNAIFDIDNDIKSLYYFSFKKMKLHNISKNLINVFQNSVIFKSNNLELEISKDSNDYVIFFKGIDIKSNKKHAYLFHIKNKKLEKLTNLYTMKE